MTVYRGDSCQSHHPLPFLCWRRLLRQCKARLSWRGSPQALWKGRPLLSFCREVIPSQASQEAQNPVDFRTGCPWKRVAFCTTLFRKDTEGLCLVGASYYS